MVCSTLIQGIHATPSPSCGFIAFLVNGRLRVSAVHALERYLELPTRFASKDVLSLKWDHNDARIALTSAQSIEIVSLNEAKHRVRIDNGSAGLGRFVAADFVGSDQLLVIWEFGRAKLWNLGTGQIVELGDIKTTCTGRNWQRRPAGGRAELRALVTLARPGAEDLLSLHFPLVNQSMSSIKVPSSDARSLSWSPDGRWLAILDAPTADSGVHVLTPDGHFYRSYPALGEATEGGLGVKSLRWSQNSQVLALTRFDSRVVLLNTRTFTVRAIIEHTTTIDQPLLPVDQQTPIWQEAVSALGGRSYNLQTQPFSPPLSRTKSSTEPNEMGVAEACFSSDGSYLATRDEQMLSTVWVWDMTTLAPHAVLVQHTNVRRLHWHPTRSDMLMIDCGEGIGYLFDSMSRDPPHPHALDIQGPANLSWLSSTPDSSPMILATTKSSFRLGYPEGVPYAAEDQERMEESFDEGTSEDSLLDVLYGRKPLPPKTEPSYTERVDLEVETDEAGSTVRLDDTFVERHGIAVRRPPSLDPLDDSQIF